MSLCLYVSMCLCVYVSMSLCLCVYVSMSLCLYVSTVSNHVFRITCYDNMSCCYSILVYRFVGISLYWCITMTNLEYNNFFMIMKQSLLILSYTHRKKISIFHFAIFLFVKYCNELQWKSQALQKWVIHMIFPQNTMKLHASQYSVPFSGRFQHRVKLLLWKVINYYYY